MKRLGPDVLSVVGPIQVQLLVLLQYSVVYTVESLSLLHLNLNLHLAGPITFSAGPITFLDDPGPIYGRRRISFLYLDLYLLGDDASISLGSFMRTKHLFVLIHSRNKGEVGAIKHV